MAEGKCTFYATHISYNQAIPKMSDEATMGGKASFYGKPGGLWFAPNFGWVNLLQEKASWDVREELNVNRGFPHVLPYYKAVFESNSHPEPQAGDTFKPVPREIHVVYRFCLDNKLETDITKPDKKKVFHLKSDTEKAFMDMFFQSWANNKMLDILKSGNEYLIRTPFDERINDDPATYGPAQEYLNTHGLKLSGTNECRYFYNNYMARSELGNLLLENRVNYDLVKAAANLLPLAKSTFNTMGLTKRVIEGDAPKTTPACFCSEDNVCYSTLEALETALKAKYTLKKDWRDIVAPTDPTYPRMRNIILGVLLGDYYYYKMSKEWGGIYFDESLFSPEPEEGSWKYYLEVASGCLWHPITVAGEEVWNNPTILAWADSQEAANAKLEGQKAFIAGVTTEGEIRFFRTPPPTPSPPTPSGGRRRGRTFRTKTLRRNKHGSRFTRQSKHRFRYSHA